MSEGFPLLTTKKMAWKSIVVELLWFLQGNTNIQYLVKNGCHIWDDNTYKNYCSHQMYDVPNTNGTLKSIPLHNLLTKKEFIEKIKTDDEFAKEWGDLGPIYGKQWRGWKTREPVNTETFHNRSVVYKEIDQIQNLLDDLKNNPDSRRLMVNAWNVGEIDEMVLPPCHYGFQCYTRELTSEERYTHLRTGKYSAKWDGTQDKMEYYDSIGVPKRAISLMWNQRSVDTFLGLPFNIASYGLLLIMIAWEMNMIPDELIGNLGDTHLYLDHLEQAKEQIGREPFPLPTVIVQDGVFCSSVEDFVLLNYQSHSKIDAPMSI
jgi:thymidylate synthase